MKRLIALLMMLLPLSAYAALPFGAIFEVNSSATGTAMHNGGGFDPTSGSTFATDLACTSATSAAPVCTSASYNFVAADAAATTAIWLFIKSGTNYYPNCWYKASSVAANAVTVDATIGHGVCESLTNRPYPAFLPNTNQGVASVASPTGGTWGADRSQSTAALISDSATLTLGTGGTSGTTSVSGHFNVSDVGSSIVVTAGTGCTTGRYFITAVSGSTATFHASAGTAASVCTFSLGGALLIGSTSSGFGDSAWSTSLTGTNGSGANRVFVKAGTYNTSQLMSYGAGGTQAPIIMEGYNTLRGDISADFTKTMPVWTTGAFNSAFGNNFVLTNINLVGSGAQIMTSGSNSRFIHDRFVNTSTTANRSAFYSSQTATYVSHSEMISYMGYAMQISASANIVAFGNYIHSSTNCLETATNTSYMTFIHNTFEDCAAFAIHATAAMTSNQTFVNNTFIGNNSGDVALSLTTGTTAVYWYNNIIYNYATGISDPDTQFTSVDNYNNYFGNGADVASSDYTKWQKGLFDKALDPQFSGESIISVSAASVSGSTVTKTGAFSSVTDNVDFFYLISGTGATAGHYLITSHTANTVTLSSAPGGSGSDIVGNVTTGHNFAVGNTSLKGVGSPGAFQGSNTTGYVTPGAVQPSAASGGQVSRVTIN